MRFFVITATAVIFCLALPLHANEGTAVTTLSMHGEAAQITSPLPYVSENAQKGGTFTQCAIGTFDTLNDNTMKGKPAQGLHLLNDPLMRRIWSEPFTLHGVIAKQVILPDDRSSITFILNENAVFHDGSQIKSSDVQFSFNTLKEKGKPNTRNVYNLVETVSIIDDQTIRFDFNDAANRETPMILAMMPIYSKAYWNDRIFDETSLDIPMGNGPYKIASIDQGRKIVFEKKEDYWASDNPIHIGHFNFERMEFDYYRDEQVAIEAFKAGDCDIRREGNPTKWQTNYDINESYIMDELPHSRPEPARGFIMNTRREPLNDVNVRKALSLAFDFDWMNTGLFHGKAKRLQSTFENTNLKSDFSFENNGKRQNLKLANELLNQTQWDLKNGERFELSLILNDPAAEKIALVYARDLKRLGITLNIRTLDTAQFFGALNDYDYDMVLWRWINSLSPGSEQAIYWGCDAAKTPGSRNYSGICNDAIDTKIAMLADVKNYNDLIHHTKNLDSMIMNEYLFVPHYYTGVDYIARWPQIKRPNDQSLYGPVLETWWREN